MVTLDQGGRGREAQTLIAVPPRLSAVAAHVWMQQSHEASGAGWRIVADDAPHLIGTATAHGVRFTLVGARTRHLDVDLSGRRLTVGVRLRPGAVRSLFGPSADEFTDRSYAVADVLGREPAEVLDALAETDPSAAVQSVGRFLDRLVARHRPVDPRVAALVAAERLGSVDEAARELGLPARTVRYLSREHLGMGLKRTWRIRRLHRALTLGLERPQRGWAQVAAATGYADQPHLIRDCRAFLGETPAAFVARAVT